MNLFVEHFSLFKVKNSGIFEDDNYSLRHTNRNCPYSINIWILEHGRFVLLIVMIKGRDQKRFGQLNKIDYNIHARNEINKEIIACEDDSI